MTKQLQLRFGDVPDTVLERVRSASIEELDRWGERLIDAERLEDLFDEG